VKEIRNIIAAYEAADLSNQQMALASVVNVEESSYRRIGARMLVSSNGNWIGGISGGCLEGDALKRSQKAIYNNAPSRVVYDTMDDDKNQIGVGLGCNGRIEVLFTPINSEDPNNEIEQLKKVVNINAPTILIKVIESGSESALLGRTQLIKNEDKDSTFMGLPAAELTTEVWQRKKNKIFTHPSQPEVKILIEHIRPEMRLIIIGDNYDVHAMVGLVYEMGWEIYIVGRPKKIPKSIFGLAHMVLNYEDIDQVEVHDYTAVVLMSHDYNWDKAMLPHVLKKKPRYIGMLGPKKRAIKMQTELGDIDLESLPNFFSPIGLDIGAETPEEIALSVIAEIIAFFRDKKGASLKYKVGSIHDRE
jgi:xanthine dehydrogenase accessory factor